MSVYLWYNNPTGGYFLESLEHFGPDSPCKEWKAPKTEVSLEPSEKLAKLTASVEYVLCVKDMLQPNLAGSEQDFPYNCSYSAATNSRAGSLTCAIPNVVHTTQQKKQRNEQGMDMENCAEGSRFQQLSVGEDWKRPEKAIVTDMETPSQDMWMSI